MRTGGRTQRSRRDSTIPAPITSGRTGLLGGASGELDCPENARARAQSGSHEVVLDPVAQLRHIDIAAKELSQPALDRCEKPGGLRHSAAQNDSLRRESEHDGEQAEREIPGLQPPDLVIDELLGRTSPPHAQCLPGSEALEAVAVEGAGALKGVALSIVRNADVSELRMSQSVQRVPVNDEAAADPGPHRHVAEGVEAHRGAPSPLADRRGGDVGVEADRNTQCRLEARHQGGAGPSGLGGAGYASPIRRGRIDVDRTEAADPEGGEVGGCPKEIDGAADRLLRRRRRKGLQPRHSAGAVTDRAGPLGPPRLDTAKSHTAPCSAPWRTRDRCTLEEYRGLDSLSDDPPRYEREMTANFDDFEDF